jgi:hypothetical protein
MPKPSRCSKRDPNRVVDPILEMLCETHMTDHCVLSLSTSVRGMQFTKYNTAYAVYYKTSSARACAVKDTETGQGFDSVWAWFDFICTKLMRTNMRLKDRLFVFQRPITHYAKKIEPEALKVSKSVYLNRPR